MNDIHQNIPIALHLLSYYHHLIHSLNKSPCVPRIFLLHCLSECDLFVPTKYCVLTAVWRVLQMFIVVNIFQFPWFSVCMVAQTRRRRREWKSEQANIVLMSNYAYRHEVKLNFINSLQFKEFREFRV